MIATAFPPPIDATASDLVSFAGGHGHRDYPCLSRAHNPSGCVPCTDFSPWIRERVRRGDADGLGEYLWRVREANPPVNGSRDGCRAHVAELARAILAAPVDRYLAGGSAGAYLDLRTALVVLAAQEPLTGFSMTGEACDYLAAVMAPHALALVDGDELVRRRNAFVRARAIEASYWAGWSALAPDSLRAPTPPTDAPFQALLGLLADLPLGSRAHAADALRHLPSPGVPRTLASLVHFETRRRGLEVTESTRRILASGLVAPATHMEAWLDGWTRRDLLGFLAQAGVRVRNSWSKERLAEVACAECSEAVGRRMAEAGAVELCDAYAEAAPRFRDYLGEVRETWRVWLAFGTGV